MEPIYLDHNATTPTRPEVVEAMSRCHAAGYANPASRHGPGRAAKAVLDEARAKIAEILGADLSPPRSDRLIITSGGTEANNLALLGISAISPRPLAGEGSNKNSPLPLAGEGLGVRAVSPGRIIISAAEHQSVIEPAEHLLEQGWRMDTLGLTPQGVVRVEQLLSLLNDTFPGATAGLSSSERDTAGQASSGTPVDLVSVILANHETGVIQPIRKIADLCNRAGVPTHTDAVQAVGKIPVDFRRLGTAAMSLSAHKFRGPPGVGALIVRSDIELSPLMFGGHHQSGLRPGTEPIALVVGMAAALELWQKEQEEYARRLTELRDRFESGLRSALPNIVIHGADAERLPQTSGVAFPGLDGQRLLAKLDAAGVACSIGAACSSDMPELSPTLRAMDLSKELVASSLRFSFGATNTTAEIDEAVRRIAAVCQ